MKKWQKQKEYVALEEKRTKFSNMVEDCAEWEALPRPVACRLVKRKEGESEQTVRIWIG